MPKAMIDGVLVDVPANALFADDGSTPFVPPTNTPGPGDQFFTAGDLERVREEEKNKLYPRIEALQQTVADLTSRVEPLTQAEEQRLQQAQAEEQRLAEEARRAKEAELSPVEVAEARIAEARAEWEKSQAELRGELDNERALRAKEKEFNDLREYAQAQVAAHTEGDNADIAPQFVPWITGNSREEIDAAIARAVVSTQSLLDEFQQITQQVGPDGQPVVQQPTFTLEQPPAPQAPPTFAGSRAWSGPPQDTLGEGTQTLTAEQIAAMPMDQYAKLRPRLGVAPSGQNRGLFG